MDLSVLADKMSNLAFSSNDFSFDKLQKLSNLNVTFAPRNDISVNLYERRNLLFREYYYYKAFLVSFYVHTVFSSQIQMNEMNKLVELYMERLRVGFNNNITGYGNNFDSFVGRYNTYFDIALNYLGNQKSQVPMMNEMNEFCASNLGYNSGGTVLAAGFLKEVFYSLHKSVSDEVNKFNKGNSGSSGSCYVATATYQDVMHPNVVLLRDYRDRFLRKSVFGRLFIALYYTVGPYLAYFPENFTFIRRMSKNIIDSIVLKIREKYY